MGVEFDLSDDPKNRQTIGLNLKYSWNTWKNYSPVTVYNLLEVKPEWRYYWRFESKAPRDPSDTTTRSFKQWFQEDVWSFERVNAKTWRAWYVGAYAQAGAYAEKLGTIGRQGSYYGIGGSIGYSLPLYNYNTHFIDVEFGLSMGFMLTQYSAFSHNPIGNYYVEEPALSRRLHMIPYPLVTELKVAFVYRTRPISEKYKGSIVTESNARKEARRAKKALRDEQRRMQTQEQEAQ